MMLKKFKLAFRKPSVGPAFVIGTGRSGTHWLGYALKNHPDVRATVEARPMFQLSVKMALDPNLEASLLNRLVGTYKWELLKSFPRLYLDKSHPNIWIAEKLLSTFPNSLFLGVERNPYATVASMMKHEGVSAWHRRWREFPIPNRFLGITPTLAETYDRLSLASQCALRWLAHFNRMRQLETLLNDRLFVISYEAFANDPAKIARDLQSFLRLDTPLPVPKVKVDSLHKWKQQLSDQQIADIQDIVGLPPQAFHGARGPAEELVR